MKIRLLGTASGKPVLHRSASAMWIQQAETCFLIDAGDNVARQLIRFGCMPHDMDAIVISHTHPDHVAGLPGLLQWMHLEKRTEPLAIYMAESIVGPFQNALSLFNLYPERWEYSISWHKMANLKYFSIGSVRINPVNNDHLVKLSPYAKEAGLGSEAFSFLLEENGNRILVSADAPDLNHLVPYADNCSLLITECTHVSMDEIIRFARSAQIDRVILTHIPPESEPVFPKERTTGQLTLIYADDGDCFEV